MMIQHTRRRALLKFTSNTLTNVFLIAYSVFCIFPIIWMILSSFKSSAEFNADIMAMPTSIKFSNYIDAFKTSNMGLYSLNSFFNALVSTVIVLFLAFIIGYFLARFSFTGKKFLTAFFMFGMLIPIHALLVPTFILFKKLNLFDQRFTLIIPYVAFGLPIAVFLFTSYIKGIPKELEEAAIIDGASFPKILFTIIFPVCRPIVLTIGILQFFSKWNEFPFALVLVNSEKYKTIPIGLRNFSGQYATNYPLLMAGLVLAIIPVILIYVIFNKKIIEGMTTGAVKG